MKKDLYVSFTDYDYLRDFRKHEDFVSPAEYEPFEFEKTSSWEFGKLKLDNMYLHLIADASLSSNCPWCGCEVQEFFVEKPEYEVKMGLMPLAKAYAKCMDCLARGPTLNIRLLDTEDKEMVEVYKDFVLQRWRQRVKRNPEMMGKNE